jgi:hypothetical protein
MARRKAPVIPDALLDQLLAGRDPQAALGKDGLIDEQKRALASRTARPQPGTAGSAVSLGSVRTALDEPCFSSNLPVDEWTSVFGAEWLTGALLDRLTHDVHILESPQQ